MTPAPITRISQIMALDSHEVNKRVARAFGYFPVRHFFYNSSSLGVSLDCASHLRARAKLYIDARLIHNPLERCRFTPNLEGSSSCRGCDYEPRNPSNLPFFYIYVFVRSYTIPDVLIACEYMGAFRARSNDPRWLRSISDGTEHPRAREQYNSLTRAHLMPLKLL